MSTKNLDLGAKALFLRERKYHTPTEECPEPPNWEDLGDTSLEYYRDNARAVIDATSFALEAERRSLVSQDGSSGNPESSEQNHSENASKKAVSQSCNIPCAEPDSTAVLINPDCRDGKHTSCSSIGWDEELEAFAPCPCPCHT